MVRATCAAEQCAQWKQRERWGTGGRHISWRQHWSTDNPSEITLFAERQDQPPEADPSAVALALGWWLISTLLSKKNNVSEFLATPILRLVVMSPSLVSQGPSNAIDWHPTLLLFHVNMFSRPLLSHSRRSRPFSPFPQAPIVLNVVVFRMENSRKKQRTRRNLENIVSVPNIILIISCCSKSRHYPFLSQQKMEHTRKTHFSEGHWANARSDKVDCIFAVMLLCVFLFLLPY